MPRGGPRPNSGRREGSKNKKTQEREQQREKLLAEWQAANPDVKFFEGDAVDFMKMIYRDPRLPVSLRYDAAKNVAPYERPRLAAVLTNIDPHTGQSVTPPAPPSLFVSFDGGKTSFDINNVNAPPTAAEDEDIQDVDDEAEAASAPGPQQPDRSTPEQAVVTLSPRVIEAKT